MKLQVSVITEDLKIIDLGIFSDSRGIGGTKDGYTPWQVVYEKLPPGIHRLRVMGLRGNNESSGLAVDNIEVDLCQQFEGR